MGAPRGAGTAGCPQSGCGLPASRPAPAAPTWVCPGCSPGRCPRHGRYPPRWPVAARLTSRQGRAPPCGWSSAVYTRPVQPGPAHTAVYADLAWDFQPARQVPLQPPASSHCGFTAGPREAARSPRCRPRARWDLPQPVTELGACVLPPTAAATCVLRAELCPWGPGATQRVEDAECVRVRVLGRGLSVKAHGSWTWTFVGPRARVRGCACACVRTGRTGRRGEN